MEPVIGRIIVSATSTAVTGSLFFVPAAGLLEALQPADAPGVSDSGKPSPTHELGHGSLALGSLHDQPG